MIHWPRNTEPEQPFVFPVMNTRTNIHARSLARYTTKAQNTQYNWICKFITSENRLPVHLLRVQFVCACRSSMRVRVCARAWATRSMCVCCNPLLVIVGSHLPNYILDSDSKRSPLNNEMMAEHLKNINIATRVYSSKFVIISVFRRPSHRCCWAYEWIVRPCCNIHNCCIANLCFYLFIHFYNILYTSFFTLPLKSFKQMNSRIGSTEAETHTQYTEVVPNPH